MKKPYALTLNGQIASRYESYEDALKHKQEAERDFTPCLGLNWAIVKLG